MNPEAVEHYFRCLMVEGLGLDLNDPNLKGTPHRVAKMYCEEFFSTIDKREGFDNLTSFPNTKGYDQIILLDRIHFISMCSHHFLPFVGLAWLAYIPNKSLVGASKPSRLISFYSAKPQLQEDVNHEVITHFEDEIKPLGTMVVMRGIHGCMSHRGVKQSGGSGMTTSAVAGLFKEDHKARAEAMDLIKLSLLFPTV